MTFAELLKDSAYKLKRVAEIAIEQDEATGMAYLAREIQPSREF